MKHFASSTTLATGGSAGIGRVIGHRLADKGTRVAAMESFA